MPANERMIEIMDQGRLAGILHLPAHAGTRPCPVIIYCPGKNGERYEVHRIAVNFARQLAGQGIAFLRFDYYGLGLSDGYYHDMTTSGKVSNIVKAYEFVRQIPEIDSECAAYLGFSDGARIALLAAAQTPVTRLLLWSPLFYEQAGNYPGKKYPRFYRHPRENKLVMPWAGLWLGMPFYQDLKQLDVDSYLEAYRGRSLIVYGDDDPLVDEEFTQTRVREFGIYRNTERNQVKSIPQAGHLFTSSRLERELMSVSAGWLKSCLFQDG